jgi:hypothetical protein
MSFERNLFDIRRKPELQKELDGLRKDFFKEFFRGELKFERKRDYRQTSDGRQIPFSFMSSGQQELLPLILYIMHALEFIREDRDYIYI